MNCLFPTLSQCQPTNSHQGDAFPYERAQIIAELEHTMSADELRDVRWFPRFLVVLSPKEPAPDDEWHGAVSALRQETDRAVRTHGELMQKMDARLEAQFKVRGC